MHELTFKVNIDKFGHLAMTKARLVWTETPYIFLVVIKFARIFALSFLLQISAPFVAIAKNLQ